METSRSFETVASEIGANEIENLNCCLQPKSVIHIDSAPPICIGTGKRGLLQVFGGEVAAGTLKPG